MVIKGTTQLLGVIGYPVAHSFSPLMHNAAIAHLNEQAHLSADFVYLPFPVHPDGLKDAIAGFKAIGLCGFNITIPHKQAIIPLLDSVSEAAQAIGAVNTVWRASGNDDADGEFQWCGTNTDVTGFLAPLKALGRDWTEAAVIILGNGGAARAVVAACHELGCAEIWVVGRSRQKLSQFAQSWAHLPEISTKLVILPRDQLLVQGPKAAALLVNATPIGMHPQVEASPLREDEIEAIMRRDAIAYDLIYTPRPTRFLQQAAALGLTPIDGLEMLVQQGAAALEIWLDQPAPVAIMHQALLNHLAQTLG